MELNYTRVDVARAVEIAFKYRNYFRKVRKDGLSDRIQVPGTFLLGLLYIQDIIIDLLVYRRW